VPMIKVIVAFAAMIALSACSTLSGKSAGLPNEGAVEAFAQNEIKTAALEVEITRLKSENARLANQILGLQRQRDVKSSEALEAANADEETDAPAGGDANTEPKLPNVVFVPPVSDEVVVAETDAPELRSAGVPVEDAPRLVQPEFSAAETVFENEAVGEIETQSVLFGVHLASYRHLKEAREGWRKLQRENPDELGLLEPRIETVDLSEKGIFLRLIGGGFSSETKAGVLCNNLKGKGLFCTVSGFAGERLSLAGAG